VEPDRERRIHDEIIVDAYGREEQALGWYYHLQESIVGPLDARCVRAQPTSPLRVGEHIVITDLAREDDCLHDMIVRVSWQNRTFGVPLAQLAPTQDTAEDARRAIDDWRYWVDRGYQL
jgi:hypothetical protein